MITISASFRGRGVLATPKALVVAVLGLASTAPAGEKAEYGASVKVTPLVTTSTTMSGQPIRYPRPATAELTALEVEIRPGQETGWHRHPVPGYGYVLSGVLTVEMADGRRYRFSAGQAAVESVDMLHKGMNLGTEPVRLVVFFTGDKGKPYTVPGTMPR
jgi:quercetin dioxygenase-like cupin family protein